jgi:bleomycin hydrolase
MRCFAAPKRPPCAAVRFGSFFIFEKIFFEKNMKKIRLMWAVVALCGTAAVAQEPGEPYQFRDEKVLTATPVKNQENTGTCWAFSTASFLESEVQRLGKGDVNLSEMFVVRHIYRQKCENYVRRQGTAQLSQGGLAHDLINAIRTQGIVPEDVYPGRKDPLKPFDHTALEKKLKTKCDDLVALGKKGELPADWTKQIDALLDEEFGPLPGKFSVGGKPYVSTTYLQWLGLNPDDYVTITSFTHHPMYQAFVLEVPDNFSNGLVHNLPLDDLMRSLNYAIQQGYTACWDADVSNPGFAAKYGLAIVPKKEWADKNAAQREATFKYLEPQKNVTAEYRQQLFDRQETMDDHLMHITGIRAEASTADIYYAVKNSWGEISNLRGYLNVSEQYMRLNTISFLMHKKSLPLDVQQRLGFASGDVTIPTAPAGGFQRKPTSEAATPVTREQQQANPPAKGKNLRRLPPKEATPKN